jgi:type II secretory pathway component PulJ
MQDVACRSSREIIDKNLKLHEELQTRRKELDRRCKQVEELATKCNTNKAELEAAKIKVFLLIFDNIA